MTDLVHIVVGRYGLRTTLILSSSRPQVHPEWSGVTKQVQRTFALLLAFVSVHSDQMLTEALVFPNDYRVVWCEKFQRIDFDVPVIPQVVSDQLPHSLQSQSQHRSADRQSRFTCWNHWKGTGLGCNRSLESYFRTPQVTVRVVLTCSNLKKGCSDFPLLVSKTRPVAVDGFSPPVPVPFELGIRDNAGHTRSDILPLNFHRAMILSEK